MDAAQTVEPQASGTPSCPVYVWGSDFSIRKVVRACA